MVLLLPVVTSDQAHFVVNNMRVLFRYHKTIQSITVQGNADSNEQERQSGCCRTC